MKITTTAATPAEKIILKCRELYAKYGYSRFLMSKFEDYDLYAENKSFLVSDGVLTFTDRGGKLKALKPDVTLSIVRNLGEDGRLPVKVFYNENVYRPTDGGEFREIMQLGLESIGADDLYSTAEVIMLAEQSLNEISPEHILDISHMGLLSSIIDASGVHSAELASAIRRRNTDAVKALIPDSETASVVCHLVSQYLPVKEAMSGLKALLPGNAAVNELEGVCEIVESCGLSDRVFLDFSLVNDISYYNGIIFQGFVSGIPTAVLSGGRYDPLLSRFGRDSGACGFAVYLDRLPQTESRAGTDVDLLLLYTDIDNPCRVAAYVNRQVAGGKRVMAAKSRPDGVRFGQILNFSEVSDD